MQTMANPVTHIIIPMLIVETYRRYFAKKKFSKWYVFLAGFFGGIPDIDLIFSVLMTGYFDTPYHRSLTHSLLIPIIFLITGTVIYLLYSRKVLRHKWLKKSYYILYLASLGFASHTILDGFDGMTQWFYPLNWSVHLPVLIGTKYRAGMMDAILLFAWLLYDEKLLNDILCFLRLKK